MTHPLPPLVCACGSAEWIACAPGTSPNATERPPAHNVRRLRRKPEAWDGVWCIDCWPWRNARRDSPPLTQETADA